MEPIPATVEAIDELDPVGDATHLMERLRRLADRAKEVVPELVGVSVAKLEEGLTFTLVATDTEIAALDGVQYAAGGPCVAGAEDDEILEFQPEQAVDEERWQLFAQATAARAVRSTLTLPILDPGGEVSGSVNLYAASPTAFEDHHEELADLFGAWARGAVSNADLSFSTRRQAEETPQRVRDQGTIDVAAGVLSVELHIDLDAALSRLRDAAARADVSAVEVARAVLATRQEPDLP
jgi:GAF domain-containing protein